MSVLVHKRTLITLAALSLTANCRRTGLTLNRKRGGVQE
ncbi:MAG: hypothetical protein ACJAVI_000691 [Candidatus Azotimanducaceae bacterium]|jgi:hypothetical protein